MVLGSCRAATETACMRLAASSGLYHSMGLAICAASGAVHEWGRAWDKPSSPLDWEEELMLGLSDSRGTEFLRPVVLWMQTGDESGKATDFAPHLC
jgi:hypothetical protein